MNKSNFTNYNFNLKENSRKLRQNMTSQERKLWYNFLKEYKVRLIDNVLSVHILLIFIVLKLN